MDDGEKTTTRNLPYLKTTNVSLVMQGNMWTTGYQYLKRIAPYSFRKNGTPSVYFWGEIMQKTPLSAVRYYDHKIEKESGYEMIISAIVKKQAQQRPLALICSCGTTMYWKPQSVVYQHLPGQSEWHHYNVHYI